MIETLPYSKLKDGESYSLHQFTNKKMYIGRVEQATANSIGIFVLDIVTQEQVHYMHLSEETYQRHSIKQYTFRYRL